MTEPLISPRLAGNHVVLDDLEAEGKRVSLLRSSTLTADGAVRLGRELIRLGILAGAREPGA